LAALSDFNLVATHGGFGKGAVLHARTESRFEEIAEALQDVKPGLGRPSGRLRELDLRARCDTHIAAGVGSEKTLQPRSGMQLVRADGGQLVGEVGIHQAGQGDAQAGVVIGVKVLIMERMASHVLVTSKFSSVAYDPFALTRTGIAPSYLDEDMRVTNALKVAYLASGDARYIESFYRARNAVLAKLAGKVA
ncbi:MAG: hypothetical protein ABI605_15425, partial [Rhizobacter sp.]